MPKPQVQKIPQIHPPKTPQFLQHRYLTQSSVPPAAFATSLTSLHPRIPSNTTGTGTPAPSPRANSRPVTAPRIHSLETSGGGGSVSPRRSKNQQGRVKTPRRRDGGGGLEGSSPRVKGRTISTLLPPRRLSSLSSTCIVDSGDNNCSGGGGSCGGAEGKERERTQVEPVKIGELHFSGSYTPHKSHWLRKALENLGGTWVRDGKITNSQLVSEEFEEKMSILYDLSMAKKHDAIDRMVTEELQEAGKGSKKKKKSKPNTANKSPPSPVQDNFPFAEHLSGAVKESMSESLLRIMMRGDQPKTKDRGDGVMKESKKKRSDEHSSSSNSFEKSLRKRSLVQCFVCDGRLVVGTKDKMLSVGGSFVNKFGESSSSRARRTTTQQRYFRATANLMGFLPHEVNIRYSKSSRQLIVSGSRSKRGSDNARQVRETIEVPKDVDIFTSLVVLRTTRGSLIFEQVEQDF